MIAILASRFLIPDTGSEVKPLTVNGLLGDGFSFLQRARRECVSLMDWIEVLSYLAVGVVALKTGRWYRILPGVVQSKVGKYALFIFQSSRGSRIA